MWIQVTGFLRSLFNCKCTLIFSETNVINVLISISDPLVTAAYILGRMNTTQAPKSTLVNVQDGYIHCNESESQMPHCCHYRNLGNF
jgi:hypothetical protein